MAKARILCVCGTGIATSTVVNNGVGKMCKKHGIDYEIIQCKALEVSSKLETFKPSIIVSTTPISCKSTVPIVSGIPFLSGVGVEKMEEDIIAVLKKD